MSRSGIPGGRRGALGRASPARAPALRVQRHLAGGALVEPPFNGAWRHGGVRALETTDGGHTWKPVTVRITGPSG